MKREEQIISEAKKHYSDSINCHNAFLHGVEWADEHPVDVWHDASEEPKHNCSIAYATKNNKIGTLKRADKSRWSWYMEKYSILMWAYVDDLLPKGGEE